MGVTSAVIRKVYSTQGCVEGCHLEDDRACNCFSPSSPMTQYLWKDEGDLEICWRMLRRGQACKRKVFLNKTEGIGAKPPCLWGMVSSGAGQAAW